MGKEIVVLTIIGVINTIFGISMLAWKVPQKITDHRNIEVVNEITGLVLLSLGITFLLPILILSITYITIIRIQ